MSAMIALLLVLSALTGCAGGSATLQTRAAPASPGSAALTVVTQQLEDALLDDDGTPLVEYSYEIPVLQPDGGSAPGQERARELAEAFNAEFSGWTDNADAMVQDAREDRSFRDETGLDFFPYSDGLRCSVYQIGQLVSVSGVYSTWSGGAHPNTVLLSWNFDLETGTFFDPALLDGETGFRDAVTGELKRQARERAAQADGLFWEDYEATLENWSSYAVSFGQSGMSVGFSPYELAAYAAGPQIFEIPYTTLAPHLGQHARELLGMTNPS